MTDHTQIILTAYVHEDHEILMVYLIILKLVMSSCHFSSLIVFYVFVSFFEMIKKE